MDIIYKGSSPSCHGLDDHPARHLGHVDGIASGLCRNGWHDWHSTFLHATQPVESLSAANDCKFQECQACMHPTVDELAMTTPRPC